MKKLSVENYNSIIEYLSLTEKVSYTKFCENRLMDRHTLAKYVNLWKDKVEDFKVYYNDFEKDGFKYHFDDNEKECVKEYNEAEKITLPELVKNHNFVDVKKVKALIELVTGEPFKTKHKKLYKRDIFHTIDTPEKAYWLGFLTADGYNNEERGTIQLNLGNIDKGHLVKFYNFIEAKEPVEQYIKPTVGGVGQRTWSLSLHDKDMSKDLKKLYVFQRKSTKEKFNWNLDKKLLPHYIRGYFDGDGHLSKKEVKISIVSSKEFCYALKEYSAKEIGIEFDPKYNYVTCKEKDLYCFSLCSKHLAFKFLDHIYKDATVYLDRKYQLYLEKEVYR